MDEQQPIINPHMNDDYNNGKGSKTIKVAIFLTILLIAACIAMGVSVNSMLNEANAVNKKSVEEASSVVTTSEVEEDFSVTTLEFDDFYLFSIVNSKDKTLDLTLRVNVYVNNEVDDTKSYYLTAIEPGNTGYIKVYKSDLGIYDNIDVSVNGSESYFTSVVGLNVDVVKDETQSDIIYELNNTSDYKLQKVSVICLFYKDSTIVDAKIKDVYELEDRELVQFTDSTKEYNDIKVIVNEAYYIK